MTETTSDVSTSTTTSLADVPSVQTVSGADSNAAPASSGTTDWKASLPEDLRSEASLQSIKDIESLAKGFVSSQRMIGSRIPIPTKEASKEARDEFYGKLTSVPGVVRLPDEGDPEAEKVMGELYDRLGRPATPDKYNLNIPENVPVDKEFLKEIQQVAHKVGLSQKQLNALAEADFNRTNAVLELVEARKSATRDFLRKEWGTEFTGRTDLADKIMSHYGEKFPQEVQELMASHAASNPVIIMMAAELGRLYQESGTIKGTAPSLGMTPEAAKQELADIMGNKKHAYFDARNPGHQQAVEQVSKLHRFINAGK